MRETFRVLDPALPRWRGHWSRWLRESSRQKAREWARFGVGRWGSRSMHLGTAESFLSRRPHSLPQSWILPGPAQIGGCNATQHRITEYSCFFCAVLSNTFGDASCHSLFLCPRYSGHAEAHDNNTSVFRKVSASPVSATSHPAMRLSSGCADLGAQPQTAQCQYLGMVTASLECSGLESTRSSATTFGFLGRPT